MGESANPPQSYVQVIDAAPAEYRVVQGGTLDGEQCRSPIGFNTWMQVWESNRELRLENIGTNIIINPWITDRRHAFRSLAGLVSAAAPDAWPARDRVLALWNWLRKHKYHYHFPLGVLRLYRAQLYAPIKLINTYGYDYCEYEAVALGALWQTAGLPIRWTRIHQHSVREVYFDGRWNMLDSDLHSYMLLPDNTTVAGMADTTADHDLVKRVHHHGLLQADNRADSERVAGLHVDMYQMDVPQWTEFSMDMQLRPGEALVWRWGRRDPPRFHGVPPDAPPEDYPLCCHGAWEYLPDFSRAVWRDGAALAENISDAGGVLRCAGAAPGMVVWKISCPYVVVGGGLEFTGSQVEFYCATNLTDWFPVGTNLDAFFQWDGPAVHEYYLACKFPLADSWLAACSIRNDIQMVCVPCPPCEGG